MIGADVPQNLLGAEVEISIAGQLFAQSFPPRENQVYRFAWDPKDAYGRKVEGSAQALVRLGYTYPAVYQKPAPFPQSFAALSGLSLNLLDQTGTRANFTLWQETRVVLESRSSPVPQVGGWSLSAHHTYDPVAKVLQQGDGTRRDAQAIGNAISTVAGNGVSDFAGDGGPATQASLNGSFGVAVAPDGSFYIADTINDRIRRVGPDGIISTVAGNGTSGFSGDGGPAQGAALRRPQGVAVAPDGSLYIADTGNARIRRVGPDGIIRTVAGNGTVQFGGDGGPATQAGLGNPVGVAVSPDGGLYIADTGHHRVRRVGPDGIITTVAGNGGFVGDGVPATQAELKTPYGVAVARDGSVYIADRDDGRIRRVGPDGIITTVAGNGTLGFGGDGGPATQALLDALGVAVAPDGGFYIADPNNGRIRRVGPDGIINTVAGNAFGQFSGDSGLATLAGIGAPTNVAVAPDGSLYIADNAFSIRRVSVPLPSFSDRLAVASEDGSELYLFSVDGRHTQTLNTLTGAIRYQFTYDSDGRLTAVTDGDGNISTIERDPSGNPTAIVAPFGQRTTLAVNADGYLARITNPAGEAVQLAYTSDGLLTSFIDARGNGSSYTYDDAGRLTRAEDPAGGFKSLTRTDTENGHTVSLLTAMGRTTTYRVDTLPSGAERRINTLPSGLQTEFVRGADGTRTTRSADGTQTSLTPGPDPRWGLLAPTTTPATIRTPAGLVGSVSTTRAVTLADPNDPFSLVTLNQTDTINGRTYTSAYSGTSRTFTGTTPSGRRGTATIDALGRPVQLQVAGLNPSVLTYDARGRLVTLTAGSGIDARTLTFSYNSDGYVQTITDPLGRAESFAYDAAGRVTTETLADGRLSRYAYDANGNLTAITPPGRPAHSFSFSPVNLTSAYSPPDVGAGSNETLYTYSADRQMTRMTRPDGQIIESGYDDAGRLNALTIPRGTLGYTYDPATGNLATIGAPGGIGMAYTYDGTLLTSTTWTGPVSGSVSRTYDNNFRVTALAAGGTSISFAYDNDGLLTQAGSLTLSRDAQNGLLTGTRLGSATDTWNYNGFAEPTSYAAAFGGTTIFAQQFTRDKLGRISQKTETVGGVTDSFVYSYDVAGRLTDVAQNGPIIASYTYDSNGNRLSITRPGGTINGSYDDQDRLLQYGAATYAYTANGELQSKTVGGQTTTYEYDALGNLMAVTLPSGTQIIYLVDGNNRRIGKQVNGTLTQGFLYQDGLKPVAELDGSNDVVSRFVYATRTNVPEYMIKGGVTYRIITDHLGSPRLVINASTGAIAQRIDYDEFGNTTLDTNPSFQPFGFAGGLYDRDTQLVRFGLRDYDPQTGRWTAKDPILFAGGDVNLFGYVLNDPVNQTDPIGFQPQLNLFGKANEKALANNIPSEPNVFIVAGHANPERFAGLTPKQLWDKIRTSPQWKPGMKVELVGCRAGKGPGSFAEKLATDFAGDVLASDEFIHPHASGEITMSATRTGPEVPVKWKEFKVDVPLGGKEPVEITLP